MDKINFDEIFNKLPYIQRESINKNFLRKVYDYYGKNIPTNLANDPDFIRYYEIISKYNNKD